MEPLENTCHPRHPHMWFVYLGRILPRWCHLREISLGSSYRSSLILFLECLLVLFYSHVHQHVLPNQKGIKVCKAYIIVHDVSRDWSRKVGKWRELKLYSNYNKSNHLNCMDIYILQLGSVGKYLNRLCHDWFICVSSSSGWFMRVNSSNQINRQRNEMDINVVVKSLLKSL